MLTAAACTKADDDNALEKARKEAKEKEENEKKAIPSTAESVAATTDPTEAVEEKPADEPVEVDTSAAVPDADYALLALGSISDDEEISSAIEKLKRTGKEKTMRETFESLQKAGKPAKDALIRALRADHPNVRMQAALILRRMKHRSKAFTAGLNDMLLSDPDPDVRGIAGRVMVYYLERKTVPALITALEGDKTEAVRMHAAWALGAIKDRRGVNALIASLNDTSTDVRLRAVGALKRMRAKVAAPYLVSNLSDSNTLVQQRAYEALKKITGKSLKNAEDVWRRVYPKPKSR